MKVICAEMAAKQLEGALCECQLVEQRTKHQKAMYKNI